MRAAACTTSSVRPDGPSACSCSSTAASIAQTTQARAGATSATAACPPTSDSRGRPGLLFMRSRGGVFRSDGAGEGGSNSGAGALPPVFGSPLTVDPADPDSAYVIPLVADMDRVTPDGRVRVYETRDAGATWAP